MKKKIFIPFFEIKQIMKKVKEWPYEDKINLYLFFILKQAWESYSEIRRQMKISKNKKEEYIQIIEEIVKSKKNKHYLYFSDKEILFLLNKKKYKKYLYLIITLKINLMFSNYYIITRNRLIQHFFNYNINNKNVTRKIIEGLNELKENKLIKSYKKDKNKFFFYKKY